MDEIAVPDYIGEILGFKAFTVNVQGYLMSPTQKDVWLPGVQESYCRIAYSQRTTIKNHTEESPVEGCNCGVHATKTLTELISYAEERGGVIGVIGLSGKVIDQVKGYRAQKARPVALIKYGELSHIRVRVAEDVMVISGKYGVGLTSDWFEQATVQGLTPERFVESVAKGMIPLSGLFHEGNSNKWKDEQTWNESLQSVWAQQLNKQKATIQYKDLIASTAEANSSVVLSYRAWQLAPNANVSVVTSVASPNYTLTYKWEE